VIVVAPQAPVAPDRPVRVVAIVTVDAAGARRQWSPDALFAAAPALFEPRWTT
jgi:hypothetical protein